MRTPLLLCVVFALFACELLQPPVAAEGEGRRRRGGGEGEGEGEGDNRTAFCLRSAECSEEADPAQFCADQRADCDADPDCRAQQATCVAETNALLACLLANGTCDEVDGAESSIFGLDALSPGGDCDELVEDANDCANGGEGEGEGPCGVDEFSCGDGDCIPADFLCDGEFDCVDQSDEAPIAACG